MHRPFTASLVPAGTRVRRAQLGTIAAAHVLLAGYRPGADATNFSETKQLGKPRSQGATNLNMVVLQVGS